VLHKRLNTQVVPCLQAWPWHGRVQSKWQLEQGFCNMTFWQRFDQGPAAVPAFKTRYKLQVLRIRNRASAFKTRFKTKLFEWNETFRATTVCVSMARAPRRVLEVVRGWTLPQLHDPPPGADG
jgi:hypothetical protein